MKQIRIVCVFFGLLIMVFSCKEKTEDIELNSINKFIKTIEFPLDYKWVVILPGLGCHGCIQEGEYFMQNHINNENILFVLTKIESLKILQSKIGVNIKEHKNIYVDRDNVFNMPTDNAIYPCIVKLGSKGGNVEEYVFQSPKSSMAFSTLSERL